MRKLVSLLIIGVLTFGLSGLVFAANTPTLNQAINAGTLSTDILNGSRVAVASPSATMTAKAFSFDCQTGGSASTGTLGSTAERQYVLNPNAANNGWTLSIAATSGATALWTSGGNTFDFNDAGTGGCTDNTSPNDTDGRAGQLTINPNAGTVLADCVSCTLTGITKGSTAAFVETSANSVTLLTAAAGSDDVWRGYLYGSTLSQTIPAEQAAGAYSLNMTITVAAS
ncbi:MAG TPA: hypothetical protein VD735_06320 [Candidatus Saccharimonadales bacterium]|nr:hypothetical protein [Candidatus Saccharimonadales bacterium]